MTKVILLQNVLSCSSRVCTDIFMLEYVLMSSKMLHNLGLKKLIDVLAAVTPLSLPGPIFWKTNWYVQVFWIVQCHPIIWFLILPRSPFLPHNRQNTVILVCAIIVFYHQRSKSKNGFPQKNDVLPMLTTPILRSVAHCKRYWRCISVSIGPLAGRRHARF